jgi:heat shock protein HslJ
VDGEASVINLNGRMFVSEAVTGRSLVPGTEVRLGFERSGFSATAGCNSMSGVFRFDHNILVVTSVSSTAVGCDAPHQEQDNWLSGFLLARPETYINEPRITLTKDVTTLTLLDREIASPDRPLVGTQWFGSGINNGAGVTVGMDSALLSVAFGPDGAFQGSSGCQRANGGVVAQSSTIAFTALTYDSGICPDSDLEPQSSSFRFVLNGMDVTFSIEERELTISRAGTTLYFTSAQ